MLLVVMTSVAYLVLPRGRMCPRCGGYTSPVMLRRMLRVFEHWVQWRWCSRCAWEGPGRKGPALGLLDPPADHESGFRWGHPNLQGVPVFYWRDEHDVPETSDPPPVHPSGFRWSDDEREGEDRRVAERRQGDHPSGFRFRARGEADAADLSSALVALLARLEASSFEARPRLPVEAPEGLTPCTSAYVRHDRVTHR